MGAPGALSESGCRLDDMYLALARDLKHQLQEESLRALQASAGTDGYVAVGVSVSGPAHRAAGSGPVDGSKPRFGLAVRFDAGSTAAETVAARARAIAPGDVDVRETGPIVALAPHQEAWSPADLQRRVRPLRPGLSIAHRDVSAGTIGAFVSIADGAAQVLSNNHVLADSDRGRPGDPVLQPGSADSGREPQDRIGRLGHVVPLSVEEPNLVDAATCWLDDPDGIDPTYPGGRLIGGAEPDGDVEVHKVGRTTGLTRGMVTAIELDNVLVQYPAGPLRFDGQVEVTGTGAGPFSRGGDSGSLVYHPDTMQALALLFAGSERGGENGQGLTFCNPISAVLEALGADLLLSDWRSDRPGCAP